jgi:hypothetical protein
LEVTWRTIRISSGAIVLVAFKKLLASAGTRGLRLTARPRSPELAAVRALLAFNHLAASFSRVKEHATLSLPNTFERLLTSFGATTRHNFRYYRKQFETAGHVYLENLTVDELRSAVLLSRA